MDKSKKVTDWDKYYKKNKANLWWRFRIWIYNLINNQKGEKNQTPNGGSEGWKGGG